MTCPYYISGAERRKPVSVDDVCSSWKLDYNMGKVLESVRDSTNADPSTRIDKLKDISVRVNRAITETERNMPVPEKTASPVDVHKCVMREKPETVPTYGASDVKEDVPKTAPKADITNGPDEDEVAAEQVRKVLMEARGSVGPEGGKAMGLMDALIAILGIGIPKGMDAETIESMDRMVRDATEAVRKIKAKRKEAPEAVSEENDPLEQVRRILNGVEKSDGGEPATNMMGSIMDILGVKPPEGMDPKTMGPMDDLFRETLQAVKGIQEKYA